MKNVLGAVIKVGLRPSPLAKVQVKEVFSLLAKVQKIPRCELMTFETRGDQDKTTSLLGQPADDFFTNTLDEALLNGKVDVAIHSAKDLPKNLRPGLKIFALTKSLDGTDALVAKTKYSQLPDGSRIGTSSLLRREQVLRLNPTFEMIDIRGTIQERMDLFDSGKVDALIVATCALKRLGLERQIKEILPWEGTPLQGQLAVVGRAGGILEKDFAKIDVRRKYGKVFLVGAGPGDPELFTLKGVEILKKADVVFYDYLVHKNLLDYAPSAEKFNVGKRKGEATMPQSEVSRLLKKTAMRGKTVVRLKGGDPLIFGRGADEITYLKSFHIDVEIVPGLTSAAGIPSSLGIPLTARGISSSVAFVSGHGEDEGHRPPAPIQVPDTGTVVFLMGLTKINEIVQALKNKRWPASTPVIVISKGTGVEEKIVVGDLSDIEVKVKAEALAPPALIMAGQTVDFYSEKSPQPNILYLGTYPEKYKRMGRIIHFPMITLKAARIKKPSVFMADLKRSEIVLLTSRCGVKFFFEYLSTKKMAIENLRRKDFIVIGADTEKQLRVYGFSAKLVSEDETSQGLFKAMKKSFQLKGKTIIFPRSSLSNPYLKQRLAQAGARIKEVVVYENMKPAKRALPAEKIDQVFFTSPSTVVNFLKDYGSVPKGWNILAKGRLTRETLRQAGYSCEILVSE